MKRLLSMLVLALSATPAAAAAQQAGTCGWDFLDAPDTPPTLQKLRSRAEQVPAWLPEAEARLLRWYRSCDHAASRTAAMTLERVRRRNNSRDPLLLAYRGVALVRGPDVQIERAEGATLRAVHLDSNSERDGARILAALVERTGWPELAEELAAVGVLTRDQYTLRLAHDALWRVAESQTDSVFWSALAELEVARGDHPAAQRAAARAPTAPRALRALGLSHLLPSDNAAVGATSYLAGLQHASELSDIQPYFDDLRMLLAEDELAQWRALQSGHGDWIRRKWEWRATMSGVRVADRLAVNARRLQHAASKYLRGSYRGATPMTSIWFDSASIWRQPLDDRGLIYVRHGEPLEELRMKGPGRRLTLVNRIAWIYQGLEPMPTVFEFDKAPDRADYFLAEPYPICGGRHALTQMRASQGYPAPGDLVDWASLLIGYDPGLALHYTRCARNPDMAVFTFAPERANARNAGQIAMHSESGVASFRAPLQTAMNLYAFQSPGGPQLVTYLSVEGGDTARSVSYDILLSVGDPVSETATQLDTTLVYASDAPLPPGAVLHTAIPLRVPAHDPARVTMTVRSRNDPTRGRVSSTTWRVPSFSGALLLSDLVVAETRRGTLRRGEYQLAPAPGHVVRAAMPFRLYYELYGTRADDLLAVSVMVVPSREESIINRLRSLIASRSALSLTFDEPARPDAEGAMRVERDITADLQPGAYAVVVTVRNARTGETATAETNLIVVDPAR